jgi:hypothetical protein
MGGGLLNPRTDAFIGRIIAFFAFESRLRIY